GVLNRPLQAEARLPAAVPGWRAVQYGGRPYPALVRAPGAAAAGLVITDLTPFERDLLDAYEGELYRRALLPAMIGEELHEVSAYLPTSAIPADAPAWSLDDWQLNHKPSVLVSELA